jgi:hypothetical protein
MRRHVGRAGAIAALVMLVTGCGVTMYEPGVYKGEKDPLLAMHARPEHKAQLQERFTKGQADR